MQLNMSEFRGCLRCQTLSHRRPIDVHQVNFRERFRQFSEVEIIAIASPQYAQSSRLSWLRRDEQLSDLPSMPRKTLPAITVEAIALLLIKVDTIHCPGVLIAFFGVWPGLRLIVFRVAVLSNRQL